VGERDATAEPQPDGLDDITLMRAAGVQIALEAEKLVDHLNRGADYTSRRRALATCRGVERLASALADELATVDPGGWNGR
jgi:hypothetical protein